MPSPTSSTRPTSVAWRRLLNWLISLERTETISSALNLMGASFQELVRELVEAGLHGAVELPVGDADEYPADQVRVNVLDQDRVLLERGPDFRLELLALGVVQRRGRDDVDPHPLVLLVQEPAEAEGDRPEQVDPAVVIQ